MIRAALSRRAQEPVFTSIVRMTPTSVNNAAFPSVEGAAVRSGVSHSCDQTLLVPQLVARQAASAPDAIALTGSSEVLTYGELDRQANRLALLLRSMGVGRKQ